MLTRWSLAASLALAALVLMPAGAHLLALPNKIGMSADDYLVAQQAYRGWAFTGVLVFAGIIATTIYAWRARGTGPMGHAVQLALACLVASQVVFWTLVFPGNQQTQNWTTLPANWETLRERWEYGHALAAALDLVALCALLASLLRSDPLLPRHGAGRALTRAGSPLRMCPPLQGLPVRFRPGAPVPRRNGAACPIARHSVCVASTKSGSSVNGLTLNPSRRMSFSMLWLLASTRPSISPRPFSRATSMMLSMRRAPRPLPL